MVVDASIAPARGVFRLDVVRLGLTATVAGLLALTVGFAGYRIATPADGTGTVAGGDRIVAILGRDLDGWAGVLVDPAADRAGSYQMPAEVIDGNDVLVVYDAVRRAAERARAGDGPTIIEARTYRHFGHSRTDPAKYRPADEVEQWLKHDPLDLARKQLSDRGVPDADVAEVDERATSTVTAAVAAASAAPAADPADALTDVWADGGYAWRT